MKLIIGVLLIVITGLAGCATLQTLWNDNQDQAVTKAALCQDAQLGLAIWSVMAESSTPETTAYWKAYRRGIDLAIKTYCLGS